MGLGGLLVLLKTSRSSIKNGFRILQSHGTGVRVTGPCLSFSQVEDGRMAQKEGPQINPKPLEATVCGGVPSKFSTSLL